MMRLTLCQPVVELMNERAVVLIGAFEFFVPLSHETQDLCPDRRGRRPIGDDALEPIGKALG